MSRFVWVVAALISTFLAGQIDEARSQGVNAQGQAMILPADPDSLMIETVSGNHNFVIEIADEQNERSAGLMFRTDMNDDRGMLFVFERQQRQGFWMQNTPMPLDLVFIDDKGFVVAIRWGEPFSTDTIAPLAPARFVLELKAGTAQKIGMAKGDRVRHPRIDQIAGTG